MKLVKPFTKILTNINRVEVLKTLEIIARTCYKSEDKITEDEESARKLIKLLLTRNHEAMLEFYDITVKFVCDRGVSHEIVRHRIASYAQESTRYVNYSSDGKQEGCTFIIPEWCPDIVEMATNSVRDLDDLIPKTCDYRGDRECTDMQFAWAVSMLRLSNQYDNFIKAGWKPEQARTILPNSTKTEINVKMNLREWRHFFKLRTSPAAHPQMRELTIPLLNEFQLLLPELFKTDDLCNGLH